MQNFEYNFLHHFSGSFPNGQAKARGLTGSWQAEEKDLHRRKVRLRSKSQEQNTARKLI